RARNVTSLVVTGTMTDICVLATVTAALHREYPRHGGRGRRGHPLARDPAGGARHHRARLRPRGGRQGSRRPDRELVVTTSGEGAMKGPLRFSGVMPANVLPFRSDLAIDEPAYRRHLRWLADTRGVTGIVANG